MQHAPCPTPGSDVSGVSSRSLPARAAWALPGALAVFVLTGACVSTGSSPEEASSPGLRFVVQTRDDIDPAALRDLLREPLDGVTSVEPLFAELDEEDDPQMRRMFVVTVEGETEEADARSAWDTAYELRELDEIVEAEPDQPVLMTSPLERLGPCFVDTEPPAASDWSILEIRADRAWELEPPPGGKRFGEGVRVCHPDTGWSEHVDLDAERLDLDLARNLLAGGESNGQDPLNYSGPLLNPGHGTATGSVIVSGHQRGEVRGVAPGATLVPIRTVKSVVQVLDSDLARAVHHAVAVGCDVISMSLGGRGFFGLRRAILNAVRQNVIVTAAAGNCVGFVVAPAAYDACIAVGGTNEEDEPWVGSSRGRAVALSAPAENVYVASRKRSSDPTDAVAPGQGTSFAVANVAGAASLWLAYHGRDDLVATYGGVRSLQSLFLELARQTARQPPGWQGDDFGAGILDVEALLRAPLPPVTESAAATPSETSALRLLANMVNRDPELLRRQIARRFGVAPDEVEETLRRFGGELRQLALEEPNAFEAFLEQEPSTDVTERSAPALPGTSSRLRSALR